MPARSEIERHLPLHPRELLLLAALADGPLHGGGLAERVASLSAGSVRIGAATLYRTLDRLVADGLLHEGAPSADGTPGRPGTPVALTPLGRDVVRAEFERLAALGRAFGVQG